MNIRALRSGIRTSPTSAYKWLCVRRDWVLDKIEYLNSESAKWRTLFNVVRSPFSLLRAMGLSPIQAGALLFASTAAGSAVVVNETLLDGPSFSKGSPGVYAAPGDIPVFYDDSDNTLRIDLGTTPIGQILIEDVTVGTAFTGSTLPSGQSNAVVVGGIAASEGFTATWLEVGHLIVDRWRCDEMELSDIEAYELNIEYNASDGQSIAPVAGVPRARGIGGGNRADSMTTSGGYYDQIRVQSATSSVDGQVDVLVLKNIYSKGGPCILSRIKAGVIDVIFGEFGSGDGFAAKDFIVKDSTIYKTANITDNVEVAISPP
jgi:hypothetical protein